MDYKSAGVDIAGSSEMVAKIKELAKPTYNQNVLAGVGPFGAIYELDEIALVSTVDGVGTKLIVAQEAESSVLYPLTVCGQDIVNHCINDILCQGAEPLFFMDYIAQDRLRSEEIYELIAGMTAACSAARIPLIGGETAQMSDVLMPGRADVVGFMVGAVKKTNIIDGSRIRPGDVLLGLPSTGLHTNGYTLVRKIFADPKRPKNLKKPPECWNQLAPELGKTIGEALLQPHRSYLDVVRPLLAAGISIHGIAHITGGGLPDNVCRVLPKNCSARIRLRSWPVLPIFQYIQKLGDIPSKEMYRVFNMGVGMVLIVAPLDAPQVFHELNNIDESCYLIGEVVSGRQGVRFYERDD